MYNTCMTSRRRIHKYTLSVRKIIGITIRLISSKYCELTLYNFRKYHKMLKIAYGDIVVYPKHKFLSGNDDEIPGRSSIRFTKENIQKVHEIYLEIFGKIHIEMMYELLYIYER